MTSDKTRKKGARFRAFADRVGVPPVSVLASGEGFEPVASAQAQRAAEVLVGGLVARTASGTRVNRLAVKLTRLVALDRGANRSEEQAATSRPERSHG